MTTNAHLCAFDGRLTRVRYRLYPEEAGAVAAAQQGLTHDFGGELLLSFSSHQHGFVSWVDQPVQHAIGCAPSSHFLADASLIEHELRKSSMWRDLVGEVVELRFLDMDHQVLALTSARARVLVCAFERDRWRADHLTICRRQPPGLAAG